MPDYDTHRSADYSPYVVHFTRNTSTDPIPGFGNLPDGHALKSHGQSSAYEKLTSILESKRIFGSPQMDLPNAPRTACFTESVWGAFSDLTEFFSSFGLGFNKRRLFEQGGGPALYTRGDLLSADWKSVPSWLEPFIKPFDPEAKWLGDKSNFLYEREWRFPGDFEFEITDIEFIIVKSHDSVRDLIERFGTLSIREDKIIVMNSHKMVSAVWGAG